MSKVTKEDAVNGEWHEEKNKPPPGHWLLFDCDYLCHRAFFALGGLYKDGFATSVLFGFLRDIITLQELYNTANIAFCFDCTDASFRKLVYPAYKSNRIKNYNDAQAARSMLELREQIESLREDILFQIGFTNVFCINKFEADDVIAFCCQRLYDNPITIVSADSDLLQLLDKDNRITQWNPKEKKSMNWESVVEKYDIEPTDIPIYKALAGDTADNIRGLKGVGKKTAVAYLNNRLAKNSLKYVQIREQEDEWHRNLCLTRLPYPDTLNVPPLVFDSTTKIKRKNWIKMCNKLGMKSLTRTFPYGAI